MDLHHLDGLGPPVQTNLGSGGLHWTVEPRRGHPHSYGAHLRHGRVGEPVDRDRAAPAPTACTSVS